MGPFLWRGNEVKEGKRILMKCPVALLVVFLLAGCTHTYPMDRVKESIQEICRKEYRIENIQVEITGNTIGVYLPVKKLLALDLKDALLKGKGKLTEIEHLFQPSPEALEQVEDVLFSISRVILSTDLKLDFYILQATDVESTGLQLVLSGYVEDIKRVRLWDISREEYRKRVLHELKLNRAVIWHRPARDFFQSLERGSSLRELEPRFSSLLPPDFLESLFYLSPEVLAEKKVHWKLGDLRSTSLDGNQVLVYVPVTVEYDPANPHLGKFRVPPGAMLEYLFVVSFASDPAKIQRVIPLSLVDENGSIRKTPVPAELDVRKDLEAWETEFRLVPIHLGDFLAEQLNRRAQSLLFTDERVQNTFESLHLAFRYHQDEPKNYFSLHVDARPRRHSSSLVLPSTALDEDMLYVLNVLSREFAGLLRSYRFSDYKFLELKLASDSAAHILAQEDLELLRRNKADLRGLLGGVSPV